MVAVRQLLKEGKIKTQIRFVDYRHEAAHRMLEKGHSASIVARATGLPPARILKIADEVQAPPESHAWSSAREPQEEEAAVED